MNKLENYSEEKGEEVNEKQDDLIGFAKEKMKQFEEFADEFDEVLGKLKDPKQKRDILNVIKSLDGSRTDLDAFIQRLEGHM